MQILKLLIEIRLIRIKLKNRPLAHENIAKINTSQMQAPPPPPPPTLNLVLTIISTLRWWASEKKIRAKIIFARALLLGPRAFSMAS